LPSCLTHAEQNFIVEFEFLTAVFMERPIFWDITPCSLDMPSKNHNKTVRKKFLFRLFFDSGNGVDNSFETSVDFQ
jgi:hypothetical protein